MLGDEAVVEGRLGTAAAVEAGAPGLRAGRLGDARDEFHGTPLPGGRGSPRRPSGEEDAARRGRSHEVEAGGGRFERVPASTASIRARPQAGSQEKLPKAREKAVFQAHVFPGPGLRPGERPLAGGERLAVPRQPLGHDFADALRRGRVLEEHVPEAVLRDSKHAQLSVGNEGRRARMPGRPRVELACGDRHDSFLRDGVRLTFR